MHKLIAPLVALALIATGVASAAAPRHKAKRTSGVIFASLTHSGAGGLFYADGDLKDKLLGRGAIIFRVRASADTGDTAVVRSKSVTIYTTRGSLRGTGRAVQTSQGTGPDATATVRDGEFSLTKGTGAYRGHTLKGTFSGDFKDGVYKFTYKGVYR
jgi:hypothetical protein